MERFVSTVVSVLAASAFLCLADEEKVTSLASMVEELNMEHDKAERDKIFTSPSKVVLFQIRAKYELWNLERKSAVKLFFKKNGMENPDWISGCIYEAWQLSHKEGKFDENKLLKKHAAKEREWKEWSRKLREN